MKALKIIFVVIISLVVVFLIVAAFAPKTFKVERRIVINASPEVVFGQVNSFQNWEPWSPWLMRDSTIKNNYTGPVTGVGNKTTWTSKKSESGSMEIMQSVPSKYIATEVSINGFTPFEGHFTFNKVDSGTEVFWSDSGSMKYPWTIFNFFSEKMMGPDFEYGLANLKKHVESMPQWRLGEFKVDELAEQPILAVMDSCPASEIGPKLGSLYGEIGAVMKKNKLGFAGPVMAYYYSYTPENVVLEAAVPVGKQIKGEGRVKGRTTAKTKVLKVSFFGDYPLMTQAMPVIMEYMKTNHLEQNGPEQDIYVTDPGTVKNKMDIETQINFAIK